MIDFKQAKDGTRIFTWQGRHICSPYTPLKEASVWCDRQVGRVHRYKSIIVLGMGNGFHVAELATQLPGKNIIVVNDKDEFVSPSATILDLQASLFDILTTDSLEDLIFQSKLQKALQGSFTVVSFAPAAQLNPCFYSEVRAMLLGRTQNSLRFLLSCRDDLWKRANWKTLQEQRTSQGLQLISFFDLKESLPEDSMSLESSHLISVLGELAR